jgi:hypothetical protein
MTPNLFRAIRRSATAYTSAIFPAMSRARNRGPRCPMSGGAGAAHRHPAAAAHRLKKKTRRKEIAAGRKLLKMTDKWILPRIAVWLYAVDAMPQSKLGASARNQSPNKPFEAVLFFDYRWPGEQRGSSNMTELDMVLYDEEALSFDVPDAALELAGSKCWEGPAASVTISFCSGLDSCPSLPAL